MKIAEALLLRKQLEAKVNQLEPIKMHGEAGVLELRTERVNINDTVDEVKFQVPRVTLEELTKEYDYHASELRKIDAAIQQANWTHEVEYSKSKK